MGETACRINQLTWVGGSMIISHRRHYLSTWVITLAKECMQCMYEATNGLAYIMLLPTWVIINNTVLLHRVHVRLVLGVIHNIVNIIKSIHIVLFLLATFPKPTTVL